jgi:predicted metal-dependent enzyme (double-stranded beta helix superfamily)
MSYHNQVFHNVPQKSVLTARPNAESRTTEKVELIVKGQGIVCFVLQQREPFAWIITNPSNPRQGLKLEIEECKALLYELQDGEWSMIREWEEEGVGLDLDDDCRYWYSLDWINRRIRYGKGEMRQQAILVSYDLPSGPDTDHDPFTWIACVEYVERSPSFNENTEVWRDPFTIEPALFVVGTDKITMDDVALNNATVPANLTPAGQVLYANISGSNFQLNTPGFPDFVNAIEASIRNPQGWCYKKLKEKADEFGEHNEEETYLRITMGVNQGDSPGIPYVMEIWPAGHYSPIHNHSGADAVIRVLSGEINVKLFTMLSKYHETPFAEQIFQKDDVTWISAELNQTHQLLNSNRSGSACITIQCYMYGEQDTTHYEYFDYISGDEIKQFAPNSDMDFLKFKETMKREWDTRRQPANRVAEGI